MGMANMGLFRARSCLRLPTIRRWRTEWSTCSTNLQIAREACGAAIRSSRLTKVAFIEEAARQPQSENLRRLNMFAERLVCSWIGAFGLAVGAFCQTYVQFSVIEGTTTEAISINANGE